MSKKRKTEKVAAKASKRKQKQEAVVISDEEDQVVMKLAKSVQSVKINPTEEQLSIINYQPSASKVVRVIAGAGTGKTSTLLLLAKELLKRKERVLYLVFNKQAQLEAQAKFQKLDGIIHTKTIHAAAKSNIILPDPSFRGLDYVVDEWPLRNQIAEDLSSEVESWLKAHSPNSYKDKIGKNVELVIFWIYKTLEGWLRSAYPESKLTDNFLTYYPAKLNHQKYLGFDNFGNFYTVKAALIWGRIWAGKYPISHDVYMKYAQLGHCRLNHYTAILLDESQDTTACQIDLFVKQQSDKKVYIVGDAAQTIYSFRGAKSKFVVDLCNTQDFKLTNSFRFGKNIEFVANQFLWIKEKSPQAHLFNPYRLVGKGRHDGDIFDASYSLPFPYTIVARSNSTLIFSSLQLLSVNEEISIAINGDIPKFQTTIKKVLDLYLLFSGKKPQREEYRKYQSFAEFQEDVVRLERNDEAVLITLIKTYQEALPIKMQKFKEMVLEKKFSQDDADVLLTTAHQAKGLEWDSVEVADDFMDIEVQQKQVKQSHSEFTPASGVVSSDRVEMEFKLKEYGDELNLFYVAVTRPKKALKLPSKYWDFTRLLADVKTFETPPNAEVEVDETGCPKSKAYTQAEWNGLKALFSTFGDR